MSGLFSYDWWFSFEWGSCMGISNRGSEWGCKRLEWGPYGAVVWDWSWYHWTHLIMLIILIPGSFSYDWWFSLEWGSCTGFWTEVLNGAVQGLNEGHMGQSYRADLGTIELISSCWSFWYLAHFSMTNSSVLNGDPVWGFWMGVLNGGIQGLNGGHMGWLYGADLSTIELISLWMGVLNGVCVGWSYGADLGTIELNSSCWSFWYLAHFPITDSSLLNGTPVQGFWMGFWMGPYEAWMGAIQGGHMGLILVPLNSSHQTWLCLEWSSWLQVVLDLDWTLSDWHLLLTAAQSLIV